MATQLHEGSASALPLNLLAQAIPMLSRHELARLTERLIEAIDVMDGDTDADEGDTEDAFSFSRYAMWWMEGEGTGCPIADPGGCEHDGSEEECGF